MARRAARRRPPRARAETFRVANLPMFDLALPDLSMAASRAISPSSFFRRADAFRLATFPLLDARCFICSCHQASTYPAKLRMTYGLSPK